MIKKYTLTLLLLLSTVCLFNGCEIDKEDDYYNLEYLLSNRYWSEEYVDQNNYDVYHEVIFYPDHTGIDYNETYRGTVIVREEKIAFHWEWSREYPNSININYADGTYSYFDDLYIRGNRLYGIWDDVDVELINRE